MFHKLYELEKVPQASLLTEDEKYAVKQFEDSIKQHPDGRYSCALPRVKSPPPIGELKQVAIFRFFQNEKKMKKNWCILDLFNDELNSYTHLGHSAMVPVAEWENKSF